MPVTATICPKCNSPMVRRQSQTVNQGKPYMACPNYRTTGCTGVYWEIQEDSQAQKTVYRQWKECKFVNGSCKQCNRPLALGERYWHEAKGVTLCVGCAEKSHGVAFDRESQPRRFSDPLPPRVPTVCGVCGQQDSHSQECPSGNLPRVIAGNLWGAAQLLRALSGTGQVRHGVEAAQLVEQAHGLISSTLSPDPRYGDR